MPMLTLTAAWAGAAVAAQRSDMHKAMNMWRMAGLHFCPGRASAARGGRPGCGPFRFCSRPTEAGSQMYPGSGVGRKPRRDLADTRANPSLRGAVVAWTFAQPIENLGDQVA